MNHIHYHICSNSFNLNKKNGIVVDVNITVEELLLFIHERRYLFVMILVVLHFLTERKDKEGRRDM